MNITIITATIRPEGLRRVVGCINNQTYGKWEHIIVNNDNAEIRAMIPEVCGRNRVFVDSRVDTGYYGGLSRNIGAMIAFSYVMERYREPGDEWVCFLDDDNLWYPNHLETLVKAHHQKPEATLLGVDTEVRGYQDKDFKKIVECQIVSGKCDIGNFLYNKDLFDKYGYFRPRMDRKFTYDFELIKKIVDGEGLDKVHIIHKPTFIFYQKKK